MKNRRKTHLAIDLGASSGRVMAGHHDGGRLEIEEVARFANSGVELSDGWHWDAEGLFEEIKKGLATAAERFGDDIVSVAVDTWGVDYVILDEAGKPINPPWMYRDARTDGMMDKANKTLGPDRLWERTGIQPMFFNTIYQLMAEVARNGDRLRKANEILFIPDYINYRLSGVRAIERTIASTSGLLFAGSPEWDVEIAAELNIPTLLLSPVTEPCRVLGERILRELQGVSCLALEEVPVPKKGIASAKSFGRPVESLRELEEALATYTARAAEKLRAGRLLARQVHVFVATNPFSAHQPQYSAGAQTALVRPSNHTPDLIAAALELLREIYRPGHQYKKTGIFVTDLIAESDLQPDLFDAAPEAAGRIRELDRIVDSLNRKLGRNAIRYGSMGVKSRWAMRQERRSRKFTTRWDELPVAKA